MQFEVLTKPEAAKRAKISLPMLNKQIRQGKGPPVIKIGKCSRLRSDTFDAWLEERTVPPQDQATA